MFSRWLAVALLSIPIASFLGFRVEGEGGSAANPSPRPQGDSVSRTPVMVELFTSEGCSSCPPADALLMELAREQAVPDAEIITLGEHVDYWDRLGWPDRFSSPAFSQRQTEYAQALRTDAYTPQMVVDGQVAFVGSDAVFARRAIERARRDRKVPLELQILPVGRGESKAFRLKARLSSPTLPDFGEAADVFLAVTESNLTTNVRRGENAGRVMNHASVVREFRRISELGSKKEFAADLAIPSDWKLGDLRAVVFVQGRRSRRILAAGQTSLADQR